MTFDAELVLIEKDLKCIDYSRKLALDVLKTAGSGHTGSTLSLSPLLYLLYSKVLTHKPSEPNWPQRDRLILSCGHAVLAQYIQLFACGYRISMSDLKKFRSIGSITPGHPEFKITPGIEASSGPLGQGFATSVGVALFNKRQAILNRNFRENIKVYCVVSDGDLQEGISFEAANLASIYDLDNLIVLYDFNKITIDGDLSNSSIANQAEIFNGIGWNVFTVPKAQDGDINLSGIYRSILAAGKANKPTLIIFESEIGFPSPNWKGNSKIHGQILDTIELSATIESIGLDVNTEFEFPQNLLDYYREGVEKRGIKDRVSEPFSKNESINESTSQTIRELHFSERISLRKVNNVIINALQKKNKWLIGGSADLTESNGLTLGNWYSIQNPENSNLIFGVREHAMTAVINGLALDQIAYPFCATYLAFADYQKPAIRMAAIMNLPVTYIWSHDSIAVGADGPTHQPIEQLAMLRSIPNFYVFRPGSASELMWIWEFIIHTRKPVGLVLARQELFNLPEKYLLAPESKKGAYIFHENYAGTIPQLIIIATGSELEIAYESMKQPEFINRKIRLVSMPSQELFQEQSQEYKEKILPSNVKKRLTIEAASTFGWEKFVADGETFGIDVFGESGSGESNMSKHGFTTENIVRKLNELLR